MVVSRFVLLFILVSRFCSPIQLRHFYCVTVPFGPSLQKQDEDNRAFRLPPPTWLSLALCFGLFVSDATDCTLGNRTAGTRCDGLLACAGGTNIPKIGCGSCNRFGAYYQIQISRWIQPRSFTLNLGNTLLTYHSLGPKASNPPLHDSITKSSRRRCTSRSAPRRGPSTYRRRSSCAPRSSRSPRPS